MPTITWKLADGRVIIGEAAIGHNLMEAATTHMVPNVIGECGGCLSCATCHVYVDPAWLQRTGPVGDVEEAMLDIVPAPRKANSRLSCQIIASDALDGLVLEVPVE